jgi:small subunit ribosomal protein S1
MGCGDLFFVAKNQIEQKFMAVSNNVGIHVEDTEQLDAMQALATNDSVVLLPKDGDLIKGTVISTAKNLVRLDLGGFFTGVVRGPELQDESGEYSNIGIGDEVEATVLDVENETGEVELSFMHAGHQKAWDNLDLLMKEGNIIGAKVISANKGGLMARIGHVVGFLPVSQLTTENYPRVEGGDKNKILDKLNQLVNKTLEVKIIDVDEEDEKLIVSEKAAWEEKQKDLLGKYKIGTAVEGTVSGVVDFGAFVEFDQGLEGLVHISELAWQRIDNPHDIIKVGDKVKAEIIAVDGSKISLSMKKLQEDPWKKAAERYSVGELVTGKVLKVNPFGLFVELDEEIHGLAHVSELSDAPVEDPTTIAKPGDEMQFKIISIESEQHRLGLSLKALSAKAEPKKKEKAEATEEKAEETPVEEAKEEPKEEAAPEAPKEEAPKEEVAEEKAE